MALSALAETSLQIGSRQEEDRIVGRRAANREALQKYMDSRATLGHKVSPEEAMRYAAELTNGGSFIYGFAPDLVNESIVNEQNRQAKLAQEQQSSNMLANMTSQEDSISKLLPFADDDPLTMVTGLAQKNPELKPLLDRYADKIPEMLRRKEREAILTATQDPLFGGEATPENVRDLFPGYNTRVYDELSKRAEYATSVRNREITNRFITHFNQNKTGLSMDDATFERNLDGIIATTAAQTGMNIQKGDKLYEDLKNSILGERERFKAEKFREIREALRDLNADRNFQSLAALGYTEEAVKAVRAKLNWYPHADLITDQDIINVIQGIGDQNRAVNLATNTAAIQQQVATGFDQEIQLSRSLLATGDYDENEKQVANVVGFAYIIPSDVATIETIKADIKDGLSPIEIANKHSLVPMSMRDVEISKRVQNSSSFLPPIGVGAEEFLSSAVENFPFEAINNLPPEKREKAAQDWALGIHKQALQIPGANRHRLDQWVKEFFKPAPRPTPAAQSAPAQPAPQAPTVRTVPQTSLPPIPQVNGGQWRPAPRIDDSTGAQPGAVSPQDWQRMRDLGLL